jgi:hypothetical protein
MAEAISFRRGNTSENDEFIGVEGEIVVDLGSGGVASSENNNSRATSAAGAPTIRLHIGNNRAGGIYMARADMANVNTQLLAERDEDNEGSDMWHKGKNLAYADLSNLVATAEGYGVARAILDLYGMAYKDTTNIDTANLVDETKHNGTIEENGETIEAPGNKPLAYRDTTNINTADLVSDVIHDGTGLNGNKPLAYRDTTNVNNTDLTSLTIHSDIEAGFCNVIVTMTNPGENYSENDTINTGIEPISGSPIIITVTTVEENGAIANFTTNYDSTTINSIPAGWPTTFTDTNGATFGISAETFGKIDVIGNKPLAYRDTSNINTADLTNETIHNSINGNKPLLYNDWSNLIPSMAVSKVNDMYNHGFRFTDYEFTENKAINITENRTSDTKYPTTHAVYSYITNSIDNAEFANRSLSNITSQGWEIAASNDPIYVLNTNRLDFGSGYSIGDIITTNIRPSGDSTSPFIEITITDVSNSGGVLSFTTNYDNSYFNSNFIPSTSPQYYTDSQHGAQFEFITTQSTNGGLLKTDFSNALKMGDTVKSIISYSRQITLNTSGSSITVGSDHLSNLTLDDDELITHDILSGTYQFNYNGTKWVLDGQEIEDINDYGISYTGAAVTNDQITIIATSVINYLPMISTEDSTTPNANNCAISAECNQYSFTEQNGTAHNNVTIPMQYIAAGVGNARNYGIYVTKYGVYYKQGEPTTNFNASEIIATKGYCDEKQNKQNIKVLSSSATQNIVLDPKIAIYQVTATTNTQITIDHSNVSSAMENNTAKTFEIYVKVGASIPAIGWNGIDHWIIDSEQTPQNVNTTGIFTVRVQKINNVVETVGNYGGEY